MIRVHYVPVRIDGFEDLIGLNLPGCSRETEHSHHEAVRNIGSCGKIRFSAHALM